MNEFLKRVSSRKFILAAVFIVLVLAKIALELSITTDELVLIAGICASYIGVEGAVDFKKIGYSTEQAAILAKEVALALRELENKD
jgi:hypothetical protein